MDNVNQKNQITSKDITKTLHENLSLDKLKTFA